MDNFIEWNNNKMYEGHVRRLTQIKEKQKKMIKTYKNFRVKSQPSKLDDNAKIQFLPLPLVSKHERFLLSSVVKQKTMNLQQKQSLLQNYLLSKRILQTHSVFDSKQLKKQYYFHKKVSESMTRNLSQHRKTYSQLRNKKFQQLKRLRQQNYLGNGRVFFNIKISEIRIVKRRLQQNEECRFNLIYKPEKLKSYAIKALSWIELMNKKLYFRGSRRQIQKGKGLKFELQQVRGTSVFKLGEFRLHLSLQKGEKELYLQPSVQQQLYPSVQQQKRLNNQYRQRLQSCNQNRGSQNKDKIMEYEEIIYHPITKYSFGNIKFIVQCKDLLIQ